ncbi:putative transcription factor GRAS family [Helianthus annuus]|nr:putative transcription factor GRAS family [Helianthus annuus]KAJ0619301.1 putative transcription factor GRAS family [Helianthus annuus]
MRGIAFEVATFQSSLDSHNLKQVSFSCNNNNNNEPISVLDTRSPSPSTSTSTPSSSMGGGSGGCTTTTPPMLGVSGNPSHQKWPELQPIPPELELLQQRFGVGLEDFESLLSESAQDQSLRWISGDFDDSSLSLQQLLQCNQIDQNAPPATLSENSQNPNLLPPLPPQVQFYHHQYQVICDQLFAAAELMLSGNRSHAQGILARLNHQFASGPTPSKPFQRAAFYFKEAMQMQLQSNLNPNRITPHFNGMFKMGAYKMFSEVSPVIQFMNFTSNQTLLEALGDAKNIHIIDFDIGFGAQWASFIQELPITNNGSDGGGYSLKITAFASPSTHHPLELGLMHENLSQLAQEIGISFELEVVNFDSFDPRWFSVSENEKIAVNFPIWSACTRLSAIPSILHFVKQLSPRIVVSFDRGCERTDLPFPRYLLQGLQYYEVLLDSIDGVNVVSDTSNKIERYLFQSQIERMVSGKLQFPEPMPHWKSLFAAGGYVPVGFSNFAETQAECVLKRMQVQGFRLEKRQASLVLCWQNRELMTASAWKC